MQYLIKKKTDSVYKDFYIDFGVTIYSVSGIGEEKVKPYYKYSWINENGVEVYLPTKIVSVNGVDTEVPDTMKVEEQNITIKGMIISATAKPKLEALKAYLKSNGVLTYKDNDRGASCDVVYEGMAIETDRFRDGQEFIQFKMDFNNVNGIFNYNINESMTQINNKDDFELLTVLKDIDGVAIAHNSVNWKIWYFVSINKVYEASHINGVFTNCSVTIDNKVKIPINGFDWGQKGILMKRAFVSWNDADFSDGTQDTSTIAEQTNIEIV